MQNVNSVRLMPFSGNALARGRSRSRQTGQSLVGIGIYLIIAVIATGVFMSVRFQALQSQKASQAASVLETLTTASSQYLSAEASTITKSLTLGGPAIAIPMTNADGFAAPNGLPSLQSAGFLSTSFNDTDAFGQSHALLIRQVGNSTTTGASNYDALLVSYGGATIPDTLAGLVVQQSDGQGGFLPTVEKTQGLIHGAFGTWTGQASQWMPNSSDIQVASGHYVATLQFQPAVNSISDYLDRYAVSGNPDLNTMHTNIDMGGNSLVNTNAVMLANGGGISSAPSGTIYLSPTGTLSGTTFTPGNGGTVEITGNSQVDGSQTVAGNDTVTGTATAGSLDANQATIANLLTIGGDETVLGNGSINGNLQVNGTSTVNGDASVTGNVTAQTLNATTASVGQNLTVAGSATVTGVLTAQQVDPTQNETAGGACSYLGEIAYSTVSGEPVFCVNSSNGPTYQNWAGGTQISAPAGVAVTYTQPSSGGNYIATVTSGAPSCSPGEQMTLQTSSTSNPPPSGSGLAPTTDLGFVCGQDQIWDPIQLPPGQ